MGIGEDEKHDFSITSLALSKFFMEQFSFGQHTCKDHHYICLLQIVPENLVLPFDKLIVFTLH